MPSPDDFAGDDFEDAANGERAAIAAQANRLAQEAAALEAERAAIAAARAELEAQRQNLIPTDVAARLASLEAELAEFRAKQSSPAAGQPEQLMGPAQPGLEALERQRIWPKDAQRQPGELKVRTYRVEPVGAALQKGWLPAVVSHCYDGADAKAAYLARKPLELHNLPLQIHEIACEAFVREAA